MASIADLSTLEAILNYEFKEKRYLRRAITVSATTYIQQLGYTIKSESNKRLALLGDNVLNLVVTYRYFTAREDKGTIQGHIQRVAGNDNLYAFGVGKGIGPYLHRNPGDCGHVKPRTMADSVEAIIEAAYLDGGLDAAGKVIKGLGLE